MSAIAVITARGGSKRIPRKNIRPFMGKPMLAYAIETALQSQLFDVVMVSTDDAEIAQIALNYGAKVPFMRSETTANDTATTYDVLEEVLKEYNSCGCHFDTLCCIYPCVPFLKAESLVQAHSLLSECDAVTPVCQYSSPIQRALKIECGRLSAVDERYQPVRTQDLMPTYFDVGMFYFCKTDILLKGKSLMPENTKAFIIPEKECQDIDTPEDWEMAEMKYRILNKIK